VTLFFKLNKGTFCLKNKSIWLLNFMKPDEDNVQRIKSILWGMPILQKKEQSNKNIKDMVFL